MVGFILSTPDSSEGKDIVRPVQRGVVQSRQGAVDGHRRPLFSNGGWWSIGLCVFHEQGRNKIEKKANRDYVIGRILPVGELPAPMWGNFDFYVHGKLIRVGSKCQLNLPATRARTMFLWSTAYMSIELGCPTCPQQPP